MAREDGYNISDSGNWNVASDFSKFKIMKPLDNCDHYENLAQFGFDTLEEQLNTPLFPTEEVKLMGFERLVRELLKLIGNSKFAMKVAKTKETMEGFEKELRNAIKIIPKLYKKSHNLRTKRATILLNEDYRKVLSRVLEIKADINEPLNKNHLIFTDKEEFDPQDYKKKVIKRAIEIG